MGGLSGRSMPSMTFVCSFRECSGSLPIFFLDISLEISFIVSNAAHKYAGDSLHPFEDCLEQGCLFHMYPSQVEIVVGHRGISRCHLTLPVVTSSHILYQIWRNTMGLCSYTMFPFYR